MKLTPRAKLLLLAACFLAPIVASTVAYHVVEPGNGSNYGELIAQQPVTRAGFVRPDGTPFEFASLAGRWVVVFADAGGCPPACLEKAIATRQVRLALGREAARVVRVFVVDDGADPAPAALEGDAPLVAKVPRGAPHSGPTADRDHIHLVDPRGTVMMRWPAKPDGARMLRDLRRLLKASQIG